MYNNLRIKKIQPWNDLIGVWIKTNLQIRQGIKRNLLVWEWLLNGNALDTSGFWNNLTETSITYSETNIWYQKNQCEFNWSTWRLNAWATIIPVWKKSISFWVKSSYTAWYQTIISNSRWDSNETWTAVYIDITTWKINFQIRNWAAPILAITSTGNICDWLWKHIVCIGEWDTTTNWYSIYINWVINVQWTASAIESWTPTNNMRVGVLANDTLYDLNGSMTNIRIYSWNIWALWVLSLYMEWLKLLH